VSSNSNSRSSYWRWLLPSYWATMQALCPWRTKGSDRLAGRAKVSRCRALSAIQLNRRHVLPSAPAEEPHTLEPTEANSLSGHTTVAYGRPVRASAHNRRFNRHAAEPVAVSGTSSCVS
jgi:hypothetical protein